MTMLIKRNARLLMCAPEHFAVSYAINPWMDPASWASDNRAPAAAAREWADLHRILVGLGADIDLVPSVPGLPDLVFTATNAVPTADAWSLTGTLTVRGTTRPSTLTIHSCDPTPHGFHALATTRVDRYAFGLTAMRGMGYRDLAFAVLSRFADDIPAADFRGLIDRTYTSAAFVVPAISKAYQPVNLRASAW